jgi:hypothetical protein
MKHLIGALGAAALSVSACATTSAQLPGALGMANAAPGQATREDLYRTLDAYVAALAARDPSAAPWADQVANTENNVALRVGDGLWSTLTRLGDYELRFADPEAGQVARFGSVFEGTDLEHPFTVRLRAIEGRIVEAETLVHRPDDTPSPFPRPIFPEKPAMNETLAPEDQSPRARMISIADGYFDTLQLNDGTLFTRFHPSCTRFENGFETTNNPNQNVTAYMALGCEAQFRLGIYRYDDRVRGRRYPLVDVERGLVLSSGFIDHSGKLARVTLTDGTEIPSPFLRPHTLHFLELFKIKDGAIEQVEANFIFVPYGMSSPWLDEPLPPLP